MYCCILGGDDRKYFDEHYGRVKVNVYYNQEKRRVVADWSKYNSYSLITIDYYTPQEDPEATQPQTQFFPHGVVRTLKDTRRFMIGMIYLNIKDYVKEEKRKVKRRN